jgi:DNA-binding LytR/AlgR family response regulator
MVGAVMAGLWFLISLAARPVPVKAAPQTPAVDPREPVLCLQMEDHYVRVHRPSGSKLELMPLREAIARYGKSGGLQVHRSWWVSTAAVDGAERDVRNWRLKLSNGLEVPVARNRVAEVRALGWIGEVD